MTRHQVGKIYLDSRDQALMLVLSIDKDYTVSVYEINTEVFNYFDDSYNSTSPIREATEIEKLLYA